MKPLYTLCMIIGVFQIAFAQLSYSKYFAFPPNLVAASPNMVSSGENTYLTGTVLMDGTDFGLFILKLNALGDLIWQKIIPPMANSTFYQSSRQNGCIFLGDKVLVSIDYFQIPTFIQQGRVIAFDKNGEVVWTRDFESENAVSDGPLLILDDQNVARTSHSQSNSGNNFWRIDKIDLNGNIIWTKEIDAGSQLILDVGSTVLHGDTIFFASSVMENVSATKFDLIVNMLSLDGILLNQKIISSLPFQPSGNLALNQTGNRFFYDYYSKIGNSTNPLWCLENWEQGGTIDEKCIGQNDNLRFARNFHLGADGGVYGVGDIFMDDQPTSQRTGWAFKLEGNGEYLWNKIIIDTVSEYSGGLTDIITNTDDSSLLACGALYEQSLGITHSKIWLLKFRADGCFNENCSDTLYVPNPSLTISPEVEVKLNIWPNPANNYIQIQTSGFASFELRDITGKLFLMGDLHEEISEIDLEGLPVGMYIITANQNGTILSKKIAINRL